MLYWTVLYLQYSIFKPAVRTVSICVIAEGKALVILLWQSCNWFAFGIMAVYVIQALQATWNSTYLWI